MVFVNSKKFACESCIKGHRSSSCHHTDRPLFEIKKKGRPVSQCTKCRELRQSKKYHSKCTCNHEQEGTSPAVQPLASSSGSKTRRFIPIVPALPNGLRDVLSASQSSAISSPDSRQRVDSLLNPCDCSSLWKCNCRAFKDSDSSVPKHINGSQDALSTLALAAAMRCCSPLPTDRTPSTPKAVRSVKQTSRRPTTTSNYSSDNRSQRYTRHSLTPGPDLAPIFYSSSSQSAAIPEFPSMPSMSEITSLAGSGCTCGVQCSCPGCVEHRGKKHANGEHKDCIDGCGTCVDPTVGNLEDLPSSSNSQTNLGTSFLDRFFARAAALPPPPGSQSFTFGSVNLPKLECCGGQCNCPVGRCTCGTSCGGCCIDLNKRQCCIDKGNGQSVERILEPQATVEDIPFRQSLQSCCAGKA